MHTETQIVTDMPPADAQSPTGPAPLTRPARALLGWMPEQAAHQVLCSGRGDVEPTDEQRQLLERMRSAVAARPLEEDEGDVVLPAPAEVLEAVGGSRVEQFGQEGWEIRLVNLGGVRALQNWVFTEHATARVEGVEPDDLGGLAELTLPRQRPVAPLIQYDANQRMFMVLWPDLNLQVLQEFRGGVTDQTGTTYPVLGFVIGALPSLLKVAEYQGRFVMTDGYHRSFGLLSRGIDVVPTLFKRFNDFEDMHIPAGLLPQAAWLGDRAPRLPDYLDGDLSALVEAPVAQRFIGVQAIQSTPMG